MVEDNRYGFFIPQPAQPITTPVSPPAPIRTPSPARSTPTQPPLEPSIIGGHDTTGSHDSSDTDSDETPDLQAGIDEQSDDEDDRQAHALLRAAPTQSPSATTLVQPTLHAVVQHGNPNFAVRIPVLP